MSEERSIERRRSNQTNITVGFTANLFDLAALLIADSIGWAEVPGSLVTLTAGIAAVNFIVFTLINLRQPVLDRRFVDRFFWGALIAQLVVFALGSLIADAVRPTALLFATVLLGLLFVRASRLGALLYGAAMVVIFLLSSALAPALLGSGPRLGEDVFYLVTWLPSLGLMVFLAGQQHQIRHRLVRQRQEIGQLMAQRLDLFRRLSHEIRNPLTMILAPLDELRAQSPDSDLLRVAWRNAVRLSHRLGVLLRGDLDAIASQTPGIRAVPLDAFAQRLIGSFYATGAPRGVSVVARAGAQLTGLADPEALETILVNFVTNALRHSPDGGQVEVSVQATGAGPRIVVADRGPGVRPEDRERIFEPFVQLGPERAEGSGLGLSIVADLAERMGAAVGVEGNPGGGSRFWVRLPRAQGNVGHAELEEPTVVVAGAPTPPPRAPAPLPRTYVLVVEDDPEVCTHLTKVLDDAGWATATASSAEQALELLAERPASLIVADWAMPGIGGPGLVQRLRDDAELRSVPVVVLTARTDADSRAEGLKLGADAFVSLPFDREELTITVRNLLRLKEREREVEELNRRLRDEVFGRLLPHALLTEVVEGRQDLDAAPDTRIITTMVVDIVEFATLTHGMRAAGVHAYLSAFVRLVSDVVDEHDGHVAKLLGEGVLVHFGAIVAVDPLPQARRAAACAKALHARVSELDEGSTRRGDTNSRLRIGISHGPAAVGYLGTEHRTEYAAVGPSVNEAFRLRSACRPSATLVSGPVAELLGPDAVTAIPSFEADGAGPTFALVDDEAGPLPRGTALLSRGDAVGDYRVTRLVGKGATALVYEVRHQTLQSTHALKVIVDSDPELMTRLLDEGRIQARVRSPNVVPVLAAVPVHGRPGLIMPLLPGRSLEDLLARYRPTEHEALALALGIARGLAAVHREGIVHRDLKPANVLLDVTPDAIVPQVCDFGLARDRTRVDRGTLPGQFMGTPVYAAPEQFQDASRVGPPADLWALGAILYEMLAGRSAFVNGPFSIIAEQVSAARYDTTRIPRAWRPLIAQLLEVDPSKRPGAPAICETLRQAVPAPDPLTRRELLAAVDDEEPTQIRG